MAKSKDTKENKNKRIIIALEELPIGEIITPTHLAKKVVGVHVDTLKDTLDLHDSLKDIGFEIIRKDGIIKGIIKTGDTSLIKEVRNIQKGIIDMKNQLDELKNKK